MVARFSKTGARHQSDISGTDYSYIHIFVFKAPQS